jgi:hypothetical protein
MQGEPHHNLTFLKQAEVRGRSCRIIHERKNLGSKLAQFVDFVIALAVQRQRLRMRIRYQVWPNASFRRAHGRVH